VFAHLPLLHLYTPTNEQKGKAEGRERRVDAGDGGGGEKEGRSRGRVYCLYFSGSVPWWGWLHENGESVQLSRERKKRRVMGQGGRSVGKEKEEKANALDHVEPRQNTKLKLTPHRVSVRDTLDVRRQVGLSVKGLVGGREGAELLCVAGDFDAVFAPAPETD
jgi:hypothetical protein